MDRGAWWATVHRVAKGRTRLSTTDNEYILLTQIPESIKGSLKSYVVYNTVVPTALSLHTQNA